MSAESSSTSPVARRARRGVPAFLLAALRAAGGAARAVGRTAAECHRAQRTLSELRLHPDTHAPDGDSAPGTYGEFLYRCPYALWHEPTARERASGAGSHR